MPCFLGPQEAWACWDLGEEETKISLQGNPDTNRKYPRVWRDRTQTWPTEDLGILQRVRLICTAQSLCCWKLRLCWESLWWLKLKFGSKKEVNFLIYYDSYSLIFNELNKENFKLKNVLSSFRPLFGGFYIKKEEENNILL